MTNIDFYKNKKMLETLTKLEGSGTSVVTLILPPKKQISDVNALLTTEYGTATNIKSRVNRLSVQSAITSAQQKLKLYNRVPEKGLLILCGTVGGSDGKERKISIDFESPVIAPNFVYYCDSKFHLETIFEEFKKDDTKIGIVVITGEDVLFASICGNNKTILGGFDVNLPKKHGRGGQSALRFSRLAEEARHNYLHKIADQFNRTFINGNTTIDVSSIILSGNGTYKEKLMENDMLDYRLKAIINPTIIDTTYGGLVGLNEVMNKAKDMIKGGKLHLEIAELNKFFETISLGKNVICYGKKQTLYAIENNIISKLYVSEKCDIKLKRNEISGDDLKVIDEMIVSEADSEVNIIDYAIAKCKSSGVELFILSDNTDVGTQFLKGFGGIGGILRYEMDLVSEIAESNEGGFTTDKGETSEGSESDDEGYW